MAAHPEGVSAPDIAKCLVEDVPRRTLQYRLKQIVGTCQLNMQGSGRWAKYHLATTEVPIATASAEEVADYSRLITLSEKAKAIRDYVGQAVEARKPVGYNWSFLEQYESNKTFYLEEKDREHLKQLGTLGNVVQSAGTYAKLLLNRLLIDLAWNSSRLEGNTYSLLDTRR